MFWVFVIVALIWALFSLLKKVYDIRAHKIINRAIDAEQAVLIRRRLLRRRTISLYVILAILAICYLLFVWFEPYYGLGCSLTALVVTIVLYVQITYEKPKTQIYGNLSYITAEEYLKGEEEFYLYLRGFSDDLPFNSSDKLPKGKFNETLLAEAVEYGLGIPMCALGMTKEIDCPLGAKRLYVNDDDWQEQVLQLMQRAKQIFILVNNRASCLWEIEQAQTMKDKIVFIVDDRDSYNQVRRLYGEMFDMPEPLQDNTKNFFFRCGGETNELKASLNGYLAIFNLTIAQIEQQQLEQRKAAHRKSNNMLLKKTSMSFLILYVLINLLGILIIAIIS